MTRMFVSVAALVVAASVASAQNTCNGFLNLTYVNPKPTLNVGDTVRVEVQLGTGQITGGPADVLLINQLGFEMDCTVPPPAAPGCTSENIVDFLDNITTTCATTWTPVVTNGHVTLDASPVVSVPANIAVPPGFCDVEFDVKPTAVSGNPSGFIVQGVDYEDAACDSAPLDSSDFQTGAFKAVRVIVPPFDCYEVTHGRIPVHHVTVADMFGTFSANITNLHRLCAPAEVDGLPAGVDLTGIHIAAYDVPSGFTGKINHAKVTATAALGGTPFTVSGTIGSPKFVDLPTAKSLSSLPPQPPAGVVPTLACYRLNNFKILSPIPSLTTTDQFAVTPLKIDKAGPFSVCVATSLNGGPTTGEPQVMLCNHTIESVSFRQASPFITNLFESKRVTITQYDELCAPAVLQ